MRSDGEPPDPERGPDGRLLRARRMDERLAGLYEHAASTAGVPAGDGSGLALIAVGGYGRSELSPASDIDLVLLHDPRLGADALATVADRLWYPLWDDGIRVDHAVRSTSAIHRAATEDVRSAIGMLDARAVAGDDTLARSLRSEVLSDWRRHARRRLPELRAAGASRVARAGWLAHAAIPDLKDSAGGLRDGVVLRALVSTWLIDVPRRQTEPIRGRLLDVRDALHDASGRRTDRLTPELLPDVADLLGMRPGELDLYVRGLGWRMAHVVQLAWRRVDEVLAPPTRRRRSRGGPRLDRVALGVAVLDGEVVLAREARPETDGDLALRAAVAASTGGLILSPQVAERCARLGTITPTPWPDRTRELMVKLLASGPELLPVWEELDLAGVIDQWLPEWSSIRLRGSSSPVHTYTIDRHSVQTAVNASGLVRRVRRADLLVVAALLHDIGKGSPGDHSESGAPIARGIALRWGFDDSDADRIATLVRLHLLLPTAATRRDIEDPATADRIAEMVGDRETLELLAALSESDAVATGPTAWTAWRAGLVRGLVRKTQEHFDAETPADPEEYAGWELDSAPDLGGKNLVVRRLGHHTGALLAIDAVDRPALMSEIAAAFAFAGVRVRSVRAGGDNGVASTLWEVSDADPSRLEALLRRVVDGRLDVERLSYKANPARPVPVVTVLPNRSATSSVVEVRADDARGLLWTCCRVIAERGQVIRSAHVTTIGPQADDVFYVVGADGESLADDEVAALAAALEEALS